MIGIINIIWFIFFGWWEALVWLIVGVLFSITIIGLPIGKACFQFAKLNAFPYGKEVLRESELKGTGNVHPLRRIGGFILNIVWLPFGIIAALIFIADGIMWALTIIGIPIAIVFFRMSLFVLFPIGAKVVSKKEAFAAAAANKAEERFKKSK